MADDELWWPESPGLLVESAPGVGECELGRGCRALRFRTTEPSKYQSAHARRVAKWVVDDDQEDG